VLEPSLTALMAARSSAAKIQATTRRVPKIDIQQVRHPSLSPSPSTSTHPVLPLFFQHVADAHLLLFVSVCRYDVLLMLY
jgi:hypothetical protein